MPLRLRLLLAFLGVTLLAVATHAALALWMIRDNQQEQTLRVLARLAERMRPVAETLDPDALEVLPFPDALVYIPRDPRDVRVLRPRGSRIEEGRKLDALVRLLPPDGGQGVLMDADRDRYYWARTRNGRGELVLLLHAGGLEEPVLWDAMRLRLIVSGLAVLWVAAWVALIVSGSIVRRLEAQQEQLRHQALHDELTGLPNRTLFAERLQAALETARGDAGSLALLLIDLDRFKEINDTLGHHYGDVLLKEVARRLGNVVGDSDTVARLGGDEFAIVLPGATPETALHCARHILEACAFPVRVDAHRLEARPSIGIALYPEHGEDQEALLRHADVAMYQAKRVGCGYAVYEHRADPHNLRRLTMLNDLGSAAARDELRLLYQPQLDLRTGQVSGVEALVRWAHPELGLVSPADFVELAEQNGQVGVITAWVLDAAIRQAAAWHREGRDLVVSVNLSAHDLLDRHLPQRLQELLRAHALPPDRLELELTESAVMRDFERGLETCHRIARLGVRLAIDDFGTGMSSLRYLRRLPADTLKIDRSFVIDMAKDENNALIVRSIVDLAHNFGRRVVAEGVQNADALMLLQMLGCDLVQGYYIHRPCTAEALQAWLQARELLMRRRPA